MTRDEDKKVIRSGLNESLCYIKSVTGSSSDVLINEFTTAGISCALLCCDGMVSSQAVAETLMPALTGIPEVKSPAELFRCIREHMLLSTDMAESDDYGDMLRRLHSGFAILLAEGMAKALAFGVQGYASRSVQEPSGEGNILGSHEGFTEVVRTNMSMLRRRLKTSELVMKLSTVGSKSMTDICLCYMKDRVPEKLLKRIESSLGEINLESVLSTGYVRPFVERRSFEFFSSTGLTERPDVLCSKLIEGRVAILVDGVPYGIIIPRLFCESFHTLDDYAYKPYYSIFMRWIRYGAFIIAILLPAVYTAIAMYHPELLNSTLLLLLVQEEENAPLSIITEAVLVLLMYEVIREAGIRLPKPVGGAVSIISGLIIGDAAVKSGLVSTPLLTMTALSALGGLVVPDLAPQITVLRFGFLVAGGMLGLFGISILACAVLTNICATEDYGFPFTAPLSPFFREGMGDTVFRLGFRKMQNRGFTVEEYHEQNK